MTKYRPYMMTEDARQLDLLAATQIIADAEVAHCWELVRVGIQTQKLGTGNLGKLLDHLRAGNGMTLDELTIEVEPPGSGRAVVAILDDQRTCPAPALIDELERLAARAARRSSSSISAGAGQVRWSSRIATTARPEPGGSTSIVSSSSVMPLPARR